MLDFIYHAIDPVAFAIGPIVVRWYGLGYLLGIAIGILLVARTARRWKLKVTTDLLLTIIVASALGIIIGGRLGYILFYGAGYYFANPAEIIFGISNGGMSFHGGVAGMVIALFIVSRITKVPMMTLGDLILIAAPVGIFLVRIANFINGELWGAVTDLPWGVVFDDTGGGMLPRHPTQLYEAALEGLVMLVVLQLLARKTPPRPRGSYAGVFFLLYGVFRIAIEFVRQPDAQLGYLFGGWFTMGMLLSLPLLAAGASLLVFARRAQKPQQGLPEPVPDAQDGAEEA